MKLAWRWLLFYFFVVVWAEKYPLTRFHKHPELHDPSLPLSALEDAMSQAEHDQAIERDRENINLNSNSNYQTELTRPADDKISMMEISSTQRHHLQHHEQEQEHEQEQNIQRLILDDTVTEGKPNSYFYDGANPPPYITPPWSAPARLTGPIIPATGAYPDITFFNSNAKSKKRFIPPQPIFPMDQGLEESNTREGSYDYNYASLTPTVYPHDFTDDNIHGVYGVPIYLEKNHHLHKNSKHKHRQQQQEQEQEQERQQQEDREEEGAVHSSSHRQRHEHKNRLYTKEEDRHNAHTHGSSYLHSLARLRHPYSSPSSSHQSHSTETHPYHSYRTHSERFRSNQ